LSEHHAAAEGEGEQGGKEGRKGHTDSSARPRAALEVTSDGHPTAQTFPAALPKLTTPNISTTPKPNLKHARTVVSFSGYFCTNRLGKYSMNMNCFCLVNNIKLVC
jgi:hypothetical protein